MLGLGSKYSEVKGNLLISTVDILTIKWDEMFIQQFFQIQVQSSQMFDLLNRQLQATQEYKQHDWHSLELFGIMQFSKTILWTSSAKWRTSLKLPKFLWATKTTKPSYVDITLPLICSSYFGVNLTLKTAISHSRPQPVKALELVSAFCNTAYIINIVLQWLFTNTESINYPGPSSPPS